METGLNSSALKWIWQKSYSLVLIIVLGFQVRLLNGQFYYEAFETQVTRSEAKSQCTMQGGHLAIFDTEEEFTGVIMKLNTPQSHYWVDLKYNDSSSAFEFSDGTSTAFALTFLQGASGNNGKLCIVIQGPLSAPKLKARDCSILEFYVCQLKLASSTTAPQSISTGNLHYFEVIDTPAVTQSKAEEKCRERGGHLCSFTNANELTEIKGKMTDPNWLYWSGLKYISTPPSWQFSDGSAVEFAKTKFYSFDPNSGKCFALHGESLEQKHCAEERHYICKIAYAPSSSATHSSQLVLTASTSSSISTAPIVTVTATDILTETLMSSLPELLPSSALAELTSSSSLTLSSTLTSTSISSSTSLSTSILSESLTLDPTSNSISTSKLTSASTLIPTEILTSVSSAVVALASRSTNSTVFPTSTSTSTSTSSSTSTSLVALATRSTNSTVFPTSTSVSSAISSSASMSPSISNLNSASIVTTTSSLLVFPSTSQVDVQPTNVEPTESSTSQAKKSSISRQVNKYEKNLDAVDLNAKGALSDIINITSEHIEALSAENATDRSTSSGLLTNIFEKRLIEYAEQRLHLHEPVTKETENFLVQMVKVSNTKSDNDLVFPEDENNRNADEHTSQEDFILIPRAVFKNNSVFVGVLYFNLDIVIDDKSESDFKDEQLNTNIISAEVSPKPHGILEKNISFTLSHRNSSGHGSNCVFIQNSEKNTQFSNVGCSVIFTNDSHTICTCNHMTSFAVLTRIKDSESSSSMSPSHTKALSVITYVGITLSLVGEILTVACYVLLIGLKTEQAHLHTNLAFSLGLAQVFFLIGIHSTGSKPCCVLVAALIHYFYLVTFSWMVVEGFHLYLMVVKVFNEESYLKKYYLFSWFAPLAIVTMVIIIAASSSEGVHSYISDNICWVSAENNFIWSFLGPVLLVCLVNLVLLFLVVKEMTKMNKSKDGPSLELRKSIKACLLLFPIVGTTWLFCVLTMTRPSIAFEYIFNILNSLQGFLLFLFHVLRSSEIRAVFERRRIQWSNSLDLTNNVSTFQMTTGTKSSASVNSVKPILGNWVVNRNENESPDLFFSGSLSGRSSKNQVLPAVN